MSMITKISVLCFVVLISGCLLNTPKGTVQSQVYTTKGGEFSIALPTSLLLQIDEIEEGNLIAVDFYTGSLNPKNRLAHTVEWYRVPDDENKNAFYKNWIKTIPSKYLIDNFGVYGRYEFLKGENIVTQQGFNGYVFVGSGTHDDVSQPSGSIYGITIDYSDHIVTIYTLTFKTITSVKDIAAVPDYDSFSAFFESFKKH